jgi:hypothetical protein
MDDTKDDRSPTHPEVLEILYPRILLVGISTAAVVHDLLFIAVGVNAYTYTPLALRSVGDLYWLWASVMAVGGLLGASGVVSKHSTLEITGCFFMGCGMLTWSVAALTNSVSLQTTILATSIFAASAMALAWRVLGIVLGLYLRVKE